MADHQRLRVMVTLSRRDNPGERTQRPRRLAGSGRLLAWTDRKSLSTIGPRRLSTSASGSSSTEGMGPHGAKPYTPLSLTHH